jgi:hypothetical protein
MATLHPPDIHLRKLILVPVLVVVFSTFLGFTAIFEGKNEGENEQDSTPVNNP